MWLVVPVASTISATGCVFHFLKEMPGAAGVVVQMFLPIVSSTYGMYQFLIRSACKRVYSTSSSHHRSEARESVIVVHDARPQVCFGVIYSLCSIPKTSSLILVDDR